MLRILLAVVAVVALGALAVGVLVTKGVIDLTPDYRPEAGVTYPSSAGPLAVEKVDGPFPHPWSLAFLPDGGMLVTERGGTLWHRGADGARNAVKGVPEVRAKGQGGLFDVVAARDFSATREIFLSYAEPVDGGGRTAVAVARLSEGGTVLESLKVIFRQEPARTSDVHYGGRIVEAPDGTLFVTLGERGGSLLAQSESNDLGKVVRVGRDGTMPGVDRNSSIVAARPTWSLGHRNPQGAALDPETGELWVSEHGAKGGDEVNLVREGRNYGWPTISYGTNYDGSKIGEGTERPGMEQPKWYWDPSIAPSGLMIYSGKLWPQWKGDIFVGGLKFKLVSHLTRKGGEITGEERLFAGAFGRIRDVREGPDGAIWFLNDEQKGGIYRVTPAGAATN